MTDSPDKRTYAAKRRDEGREGARIKLRAGQFVRRLKEIADRAEREPELVPALRLKADIYLKLLAKCLPDLKSVEHTGTVNHVNYEAAVIDLANGSRTETRDTGSAEPTTH